MTKLIKYVYVNHRWFCRQQIPIIMAIKKGGDSIQNLRKQVKSLNKRAKKARKSDGVINVESAQKALDIAAIALGKRRKALNKRQMSDK